MSDDSAGNSPSGQPETPAMALGTAPGSGSRWPLVAVIVMVCLFALAIQQRNRLRAYWWASQLAQTTDLTEQAYYVGSLTAVGDSAAGAIHRLAANDRPQIRALAIPAMASLSEARRLAELSRLLRDPDAEVSESAALALAFTGSPAATLILTDASAKTISPAAVSSIAALSRVFAPEALQALGVAAKSHPDPLARAQAVESLAVWLGAEAGMPQLESMLARTRQDPIAALVAALGDQAEFRGELSVEGQVSAAETAAASPMAPRSRSPTPFRPTTQTDRGRKEPRTVQQAAAHWLAALLGRPVDPGDIRSAEQQAEFAEQVRCALRTRRVGMDDMNTDPDQNQLPHSSDKRSDAGE